MSILLIDIIFFNKPLYDASLKFQNKHDAPVRINFDVFLQSYISDIV